MTPAHKDKGKFVKDLMVSERIILFLAVVSKELRRTKTGNPYLAFTFGDRTGQISGRYWHEDAEAINDEVPAECIVKVDAESSVYDGTMQLTIHQIRQARPDEYSISDMLPSVENPQELLDELREFVIENIRQGDVRGLLAHVIEDNQEELLRSPAGMKIHHAYVGGLLDHILSMLHAAERLSQHYARLDRDILYAGIILHDFCKIWELTVGVSFGYSAPGRLVGHIGMVLQIIQERGVDLQTSNKMLLEHMVISHHGTRENGSPVLPQTAEALVLHALDALDAKLEQYWRLTDELKPGEEFTPYDRSNERSWYKTEQAEAEVLE